MKRLSLFLLLSSVIVFTACNHKEKPDPSLQLSLTPQKSDTKALLVGVSAASQNVAWVSGAEGTILRTIDGGETWQKESIPNTDSLQFRDVYAVSADTAYVLSIGNGPSSRIYKTVNGGTSWKLQFKSSIPKAFFDCMAFWNPGAGIAYSDAANGELIIIKTINGGKNWQRIPAKRLPLAQQGEGSFAASGTCVAVQGDSTAWIATGNVAHPRVLRTTDLGQSWKSFPVPIDAGSGAGGASLIFRDMKHGLVLGGSIAKPESSDSTAAITSDAGATWNLVKNPFVKSPVYGSAYIPGTYSVVAVGPGGVSFSKNEGKSWQRVDTIDAWAVTFATVNEGWMVGPGGRIVKINVR